MKDANHAFKLNLVDPPKSYAQIKSDFSKKGGGNKMYEEINKSIDKKYDPACFVAGTLVHTKDGLRPIEEIKVGDYVLSKPESGSGELAYKRVTNTFVHENREVFGLTYGVDGKGILLVTTAEHPFWVPTVRVKDPNAQSGRINSPHGKWVTPLEIFKAYDSYYGGKADSVMYFLSAFDGKEYLVSESAPICTATNKSSTFIYTGPEFAVLWSVDRSSQSEQQGGVDFRTVPPQEMVAFIGLNRTSRNKDKATWVEGTTEHLTRGYQPRLCTVYNLEVEDYHTYFVGEHGIWVHNTKQVNEAKVLKRLKQRPLQILSMFTGKMALNESCEESMPMVLQTET